MKFDLKSAPSRAQALDNIFERWKVSPGKETVSLTESSGRIVYETVFSQNTLPPCRVSSFDGFAVRSADFKNGLPDTTGWKKGVEFVNADTGDDFPDEYDTVIAVEDAHIDEDGILRISESCKFVKGDAIRPAGSSLKAGEVLAESGDIATPELVSLFAAGGITDVPVYKKPRITFIPTGNELIPAGTSPLRGETIDTNSILINGLLSGWGADVICMPIVRDDRSLIEAALDKALASSDIVIINGGTSRGSEDYNADIIRERAEFFTHGVRAVPGRPVVTSIIDGKPVLNVPGPSNAAWLASDWLLRGLICHYYGIPVPRRQRVHAVLTSDMRKKPDFEMLTRVHLTRTENGYEAAPLQGGSLTKIFREGNGFVVIPADIRGYSKGDFIEVELLTDESRIKQSF